MTALVQLMQNAGVSVAIRDSFWLFPAIEGVHLLALALLGGTVLIVDLRLLGLGLVGESAASVARAVRPWMWGALVVTLVSGVLLFGSQATGYAANPMFQLKMAVLVAAVSVSVVLEPRVLTDAPASRVRAGATAVTSLALWTTVGLAGRGIGFW